MLHGQLLTQIDHLLDDQKSTVNVKTEFRTPQFHPKFCGTTPIIAKSPTPKIIGGEEALSGQFPWQAALVLLPQDSRRKGSRLTCGGTIITARVVLSAAHCLNFPSDSYQVLVGKTSSDLQVRDVHQQNLLVEKYVKHSEFVASIYQNDIALVYVKSPYGQGMWWNDWVLPACMPSSTTDDLYEEDTVGTVSGWGLVEEDGHATSSILQHVEINIQHPQDCQDSYSQVTVFSYQNQFCAGVTDGGKDSCSGDSGGPFVVEDELDEG